MNNEYQNSKVLGWLHARRYGPARRGRTAYQIVDLPEYLRETAAHPQPFADRTELELARSKAHHR